MSTIRPIPAFKDNYIWMLSNAEQIWVVDPGDAKPVIEVLKKDNLTLSGILLTHHHPDHSGGIAELINYAGNISIVGSHLSKIASITHSVKNGDCLKCFDVDFTVIEIPGHTLDHIAFYGNDILFCGDTLFSAGCGKIFEGTPSQMYTSLNKLSQLSETTNIYCGHEYTLSNLKFAEHVDANNIDIKNKIKQVLKIDSQKGCTLPSTLKEEKLINPFLRCSHPNIITAVEKYANTTLTKPEAVFQYLRQWKNNF